MAYINWSDSLSVKIGSIDNQHKKLIDLLNNFYENVNQGSSNEKLTGLIQGLKNYTNEHFTSEERVMKVNGYPEFDAHKKQHDEFIAKVSEIQTKFLSGKMVLSIEVTNFIKTWISGHIQGTDKRYTNFLLEKGVK
ncbi:MAG TPA: hemerythrin [Bacteroidales bacterium]|nr:MAG: hemerythrin [Bacteroidetes bacterium GWF2_33_38]OFY76179.1 MAG: hemerythrin [Bacteroidetes bacterium RIFOXYA12_FULL_33_9]OFY90539.1 MAG: hemerythrin [Bacteroidetes bacterium RIFOXYA2_FULL_33_7]HBF88113.1 hemerythrin [Bacteroidales bacterium]